MRVAPARPPARLPLRRLPALGVDCHFHVFGPDALFPYAADRSYTPAVSTLAEYERLAGLVGIERAVIVQPSPYGFDNRRTLSVMKESRIDMRAVVVLDPATPDEGLIDLHNQGVRGVRLNLLFNAGLSIESAGRMADRIRRLGWHLQILGDVSAIPDLRSLVVGLRLPVVFDHFGHVPVERSIEAPGFQKLLTLVRDGLAWVKLSGAYRVTKSPLLPYEDVRPFHEALITAGSGQLLWGTDWPHPAIPVRVPDDIDLFDQSHDWLSDESLRKQVFVDTPARFYGFEPSNR
jgi:2-pyrone-4,6-dicarboxylate lactonase